MVIKNFFNQSHNTEILNPEKEGFFREDRIKIPLKKWCLIGIPWLSVIISGIIMGGRGGMF